MPGRPSMTSQAASPQRSRMRRGTRVGFAGIAVSAVTVALLAPSLAAKKPDKATDLARELASLRGEVESLSNRIDAERESRRSRLRALDAQKTEVDMALRRETLRLTQMRDKLAKEKAKLDKANAQQAALGPAVRKTIAAFRGYVAQTMPYRLDERLASLDELTTKLKAHTTTPAKAFARLWEMVEDEMRLSRESALDRQVIALPDGEVLADVIKVGMVGMYYMADETSFGRLVRDGSRYAWQPVTGEEEVAQVAALFDAFKKKIRAGFFTVPAAIVGAFQ